MEKNFFETAKILDGGMGQELLSRGLKEGPAGRTHFGELGFLQQLWNKVRDGFRRYSKDKKLS